MNRTLGLGLPLAAMLFLSGCAGPLPAPPDSPGENPWAAEWDGMKDDFDEVRQEIRIYSADGDLLLTIAENEEIFVLIQSLEMDRWDYSLKEIPPDARRLCTRAGFLEQEGSIVLQAVQTVYYDREGYYQISEAPGGISQNKITEGAARYLMELAGLEADGSAARFADHAFHDFDRDGDGSWDRGGESGAESPPPFAGMTYGGMLAASAENRIELHRGGAVVQSISQNREIYDFLTSLHSADWTGVDTIPSTAEEVCTVVRYQAGRREHAGRLTEQSRLILSHDGGVYYMEVLIADNGSGQEDRHRLLAPQRYRIPAGAGEALCAYLPPADSG